MAGDAPFPGCFRRTLVASEKCAAPRCVPRSGYFHVLPEAEPAADSLHLRAGRLVAPGVARIAVAADDHVVELHAVRAGFVGVGLLGLLQPVEARGAGREIDVAAIFDDVVAV